MGDTDYLLELAGDGALDLGGGHYARLYEFRGVGAAGFFHLHPAGGRNHVPEGEPCAGTVQFDIPVNAEQPGAKWTLHSVDPLDVEPSILCRRCGRHGFVRAGRWEDC